MKIIVAYVPVLHDGYRKFFERHADAAALYIFGEEIIKEFRHLYKEVRQLNPDLIKKAIQSWKILKDVQVLDFAGIKKIQDEKTAVIMPDEDVSRELVQKYFPDKKVEYDTVFLRLDKHKSLVENPVQADQKISADEFDRTVIGEVKKEAEKSSDWWHHVGAAIVKDGKVVLISHNKHIPSPHSPYVLGDPRNNFHKGVGIEYSTSLHAEAGVIAEAAKKGISLEGAFIYVNVFPCPPCAKLVAYSGIKKLFYSGGYSILDQEKILKEQGVEIIYVKT